MDWFQIGKWSEVKSLSRVWLFATPWTVTYQTPQSMGFSRQEYWSELPGKGVSKCCICHSVCLTYMQSISSEIPGWMKHKLKSGLTKEIKKKNSITLDLQMTPHVWQKWRGTVEPLDESERGEWKSWIDTQHSKNLDNGIHSHHFMAKKGEAMETVTDCIFLGSKMTADGHCSHEIKRHLLLGRKVMTYLDSILKSRDITLPIKVCLVKALVFPVVMHGCESWTIRKLSTKESML